MPDTSPDTERPFLLALDIGTSSVRGALYNGRGDPLEDTQARLVRSLCTTADGGAELNAEEAVEQVARTIDSVLARAARFQTSPEAVAVSCFWHSLVGVDAGGSAVTPVFGWADTRAARASLSLRRRLDEQATHARVGCRFHPSYWPAKLLWLREEQPVLYGSVRRWLSFSELLALRFFGAPKISISMASGTGLFNLRTCEWDRELLEALDISVEQLPALLEKHEPFAKLTDNFARRWPQLEAARWFPAIGDGAANNIGAGCTTPESCALMIGTSGAMRLMWEGEPPARLPSSLWCYRADRNRVLAGGALSDGGGLYGWMTGALALGDDRVAAENELAGMKPDAHGLTVLPFWSGERSTGWRSRAKGAIYGLTLTTRPIDILRASMEGVAYRFALIANALGEIAPGAKVVASGGALFRSPAWSQIIADVLGRPVHLSKTEEASSRGACLLALEAIGKLKSIGRARIELTQTFKPDAARHALYREGLERQQNFYERLVADEE